MTSERGRHYAVRRVNPFEGVLQVVETSDARAYSANGRVWQLQVFAERPDHTWRCLSHIEPIRQFFNFGLWDPVDGLQKVPANPVMDIGGMTAAANGLADMLRGLLELLPFELIDEYECWATDDEGEPIALLATTEDLTLVSETRVEPWHATRLSDHSFVSDALHAAGIPSSGDLGPRQHAAQLERQVRQLGQQKTWFQRLPDGRSRLIAPDGKAGAASERRFPSLGLKTDWPDELARLLARDYLDWQAPRLLMLPGLDDGERRELEQAACRRAVELAAVYRLLPKIIDRTAIEAARVEARLRRAAV